MKTIKNETSMTNLSPMNQSQSKKPHINLNSFYRPISATTKRPDKDIKMAKKNDFPTVHKGVSSIDYSFVVSNLNKTNVPSTALEKEKLYEETLQLKKIINGLRKDLATLKSDNLKKENEINKKDKVLEDIVVDSQNNMYSSSQGILGINSSEMMNKAKDANLLYKIKKQFKDLKKEFKEKCEENENLKKLAKIAKFNELNIEIKTLTEELLKIKNLYTYSLQQNENNENNLRQLQNLQENFSKQHFIIIQLQESLSKLTEDNRHKEIDLTKFKNQLDDTTKKLNLIKKNLELNQTLNEKLTKEKSENREVIILKRNFENQIMDLNRDINRFRAIADSKDRELKEYVKRNNKENSKNNTHTFNYNDLKYSQPNPEINQDSQTLLLKSKFQEQIKENENLIKKNKHLQIKIEAIEKEFGIKKSQEKEETNKNNQNETSNRNEEYLNDEQLHTEFTYILIKNFESKKITRSQANDLIKEISHYEDTESIKKLAHKIFRILKIKRDEEQNKILTFLNTLLQQKNDTTFNEKFLSLFDNVKIYTQKEEIELGKKLKKHLKSQMDHLQTALQAMDFNKTGVITFLNFRKILELINISLKDKYIEYLIYVMKSYSENDSIYDLNYDSLFKLIENAEEDSKIDSSEELEDDYMNNEESEIVITSDQFHQKVNSFLEKLKDYLSRNNKNIFDLFMGEIFRPCDLDSGDELKHLTDDVVDLKTFLTQMKKIGINLGSLDVYCVYTKLKIVDDFEAVSLNVLEKELKSFKNENNLDTDNDDNEEMNLANLDQVIEDEEDYSKYSFENNNEKNGFISNRVEKEGAQIDDVLGR